MIHKLALMYWQTVGDIFSALRVELRKVLRSKILWLTALGISLGPIIQGGLLRFMKTPVGAAENFMSAKDWPLYFNRVSMMVGISGLGVIGFIFIWIFGREFGDKTVRDWLSLPISRVRIVLAKFMIAIYWSISLICLACLLTLGIGAISHLTGWSATVALNGLKHIFITGALAIMLATIFAFTASITRGYLLAVGLMFLIILLAQVMPYFGLGEFFPWSVLLLYSGGGEQATNLGFISYFLVWLTGVLSLVITGIWWRYADQQ